ncbi:uncharacterized protein LOC144708061 [Wolffia australiana]
MSSGGRRSWVVAASMSLVEALKDQGICRWNSSLRSVHREAKSSFGSLCMAKRLPVVADGRAEKVKQEEESLRTVMYLSCWGPN